MADIYLYLPLFTGTEVNNCFSIYQIEPVDKIVALFLTNAEKKSPAQKSITMPGGEKQILVANQSA